MLNWIVIVLGLQLAGELAATASGLPVPGPVIGMVLLLASVPAVLLAFWLGASDGVMRALATKSVTTPIALGVTESLGGLTAIAAVVVVFAGVLGGMMAGVVFRVARVRSPAAQGFALGLAAHGIGIGRAVQINETAAAFAGVAMGFNGLVTALWAPALVPAILAWFG